ncbi:hypothetical protein NFI96_019210 [Prochilodus magdalenae]|nr:hypothetical protein NFI96_019210 [Prochilodus magdalenae]
MDLESDWTWPGLGLDSDSDLAVLTIRQRIGGKSREEAQKGGNIRRTGCGRDTVGGAGSELSDRRVLGLTGSVRLCCVAECPADTQLVHARLGHPASLTCPYKGEDKVFQSQWSRCQSHIILVYKPPDKPHLHNSSYEGRTTIQEDHTLTLRSVRKGDFGDYCCKLTTYPSGSLERRVRLLEDNWTGLPMMMIIYISCGAGGFVVLLLIIICLVCRKRRRRVRNPVRVPMQASVLSPSGSSAQNLPPSEQKGDPVEENDVDDDEGMYLNVPQVDS